ncbi:hypothetical protein Pth03_28790 [Planotetraspora thailandica]|uniref:Transglycosylase SLT domain-containing protein n=1 Tax=Planotetraspora thailandica TaxID=487172 RepID=A0A8J3V1H4_9ACTN|nr:hypothetical protein Pth03_28790 [Planotetraspora thailandica]
MAGLAVVITLVIVGGFVALGSMDGSSDASSSASSSASSPPPGGGSAIAAERPDTLDTPVAVPGPALPEGSPATSGPGVTATPPTLLAISRSPVSADTLREIGALKHVQKVAGADGGTVQVSGKTLQLLGVDPAGFRSWTPQPVADHPEVWSALARNEVVADGATVAKSGMVLGDDYQVEDGPSLRLAASATLGLPGIDGLVSRDLGRRLGFAADVVVLIHAKGGTPDRDALTRLLGRDAQFVPVGTTQEKPAKPTSGSGPGLVGRPASYLDLYRRSAGVCPGLSWTVLAAIGQVESSHGRNNGPSSAGALGPMQFMPATWKVYGVDGDGDGEADIWSPYDAVPSAAKYLCANGAGQGGDKLRKAVWFYNHSWDYVDKVLGLASAYARAYG